MQTSTCALTVHLFVIPRSKNAATILLFPHVIITIIIITTTTAAAAVNVLCITSHLVVYQYFLL